MSEDRNIYADQGDDDDVTGAADASAQLSYPPQQEGQAQPPVTDKPRRGRPPSATPTAKVTTGEAKPQENRVVKLLDKNPLGMTLPEMAGGTRQIKRIKTMRPQLAEAIRSGLVMPVSQRAGHTVYRLVKHIANR